MQKNKKISNGRKVKSLPQQRRDPALRLLPAFPGQPIFSTTVMADPIVLSTTVTTGVIANTTTITSALITSFTTRFATWDEYRIVGVQVKTSCFSSTNPGQLNHWIDIPNTAGAAPAIADSRKNRCVRFPASDVSKSHMTTFVPHDPAIQAWSDLFTGLTIGVYKLYTDNANYGSSVVATQYVCVDILLTIQFRGFR
jgi:hypothetical protein